MSQVKKLDSLISRIFEEKLSEEDKYAGKNAEIEVRRNKNFSSLSPETQKNVVNNLKKGGSVTLENENQNEEIYPVYFQHPSTCFLQ